MALFDQFNNELEPHKPKKGSWQTFANYVKSHLKSIIAIASLLLAILTFFGLNSIFNIPKWWDNIFTEQVSFPDETDYNILLLPFQPLENCRTQDTQLERTIQTRLRAMSDDQGLGLHVELGTNYSCPSSFEEAQAIGDKVGADLVIWGDLYEKCNSDNQACLKYKVINEVPYGIKEKGKSEIEPFALPKVMQEGQLLQDVDYIIWWTLGLEASTHNECDKAKIYFENIFQKFPAKAYGSYYQLAYCNYYDANFALSVHYMTEAIKIDTAKTEAYFSRGVASYMQGHLKDALADFDTAIMLNPNHAHAYCNRGATKRRLKDIDGAIGDFTQAIKKDPDDVDAYYKRGVAKMMQQDIDSSTVNEAISDFDKAIVLDSIFGSTRLDWEVSKAYCNRGISKGMIGNNKGAVVDLNRAIELDPDYVDAYYNLGAAYLNLRRVEEAVDNYKKAIELNPNHTDARNALDAILYTFSSG